MMVMTPLLLLPIIMSILIIIVTIIITTRTTMIINDHNNKTKEKYTYFENQYTRQWYEEMLGCLPFFVSLVDRKVYTIFTDVFVSSAVAENMIWYVSMSLKRFCYFKCHEV